MKPSDSPATLSQQNSPQAFRKDGAISIGALRAFVAVIETGSFSKAAAELGMTQPNISNQISSLETACGSRLINRRNTTQLLTELGRELFVRARLVISRMDDFEAMADEFNNLQRGRLVVGFSTPPIALGLVSAFMKAHQGVQIVTRAGNTASLLQDISECRADIVILSLLEPNESLSCRFLARQALNVLVPADHAWSNRKSIKLKELVGQKFVTRENGSVTRALAETACSLAGEPWQPVLEVASREAVKEAVAHQIGLGFVLEGEIGEDSRFHAVLVEDLSQTAGVFLVGLKESMEIPAVSAFIELATKGNVI
jgi:DNA-binding transcriptional LysR family regulator